MMDTLRVSLIIATYNRGPRIASTLDSVLKQSITPAEVIVVDDCSPDETGKWVEQHYPMVRVIRPAKNGGTSASRNFGAQVASNDWLLFLDHDDELRPDAVKTLLELQAAFPEAKALFADHAYVNRVDQIHYPNHHDAQASFRRLRKIPSLKTTPLGRLYGKPLYQALLSGNLLQQPWMIERTAFVELGGFSSDIRYCEDWEFYLRVTNQFLIALSDQVISEHMIEGENLHLNPKQDVMHMEVIRRAMARERFRSPANSWFLSRRLAGYYKSRADRAAATGEYRASWLANLSSFWYWPLDVTVAARATVLGPLKCLVGPRRVS
jgi:glycosyltransferase involved in cell wall biosynthesis